MSTDPVPGGQPETVSPAVALRSSLSALIEESKALRTDVHGAEAARKRANVINLGVLLLLASFVGLLLLLNWQNNQLAHQVNQTNKQIADCTTAGGKCYQQGSQRTGTAIGDIIRAELYMAECSRMYPGEAGPGYDRKLEACVYGRLLAASKARDQASATPTPSPVPSPVPSVSVSPAAPSPSGSTR